MNDFRNTYQDAMADLKTIHIDVNSVLDEGRRKRLKKQRIRQKCITAMSAACIFCLCTIGTVQAAEYVKTVIKVNEYGFRSADTKTMALNEEEQAAGGAAASFVHHGMTQEELERQMKEIENLEEDEVIIEDYCADGAVVLETETAKEYDSIEEFRANEEALFAFPDMELLGETIDAEHVWVSGMFITVRIESGEKSIYIDCMDYSDSSGHASSTVFPSGVCNERTYMTKQGYEYILIDGVRKTPEEPLSIHAAATVGNYEIYMDFQGYKEEEAERILESMDISLYEPDNNK